jgi:hypothetical protein
LNTRTRLPAVIGMCSLVAVFATPAPALAQAPTKTGWWTQVQQSATTGNNPLPLDQSPNASDFHISNAGCPAQIAPCSSVPDGVTPGDPVPSVTSPVKFGPTAISAVAYALPDGGLPTGTDPGTVIAQLTLIVDGAAVDRGFKLLACKVLGAWSPANGGDWVQRPPYQPGGCAVGVASADGTTVGFTIVAGLAARTSLDLALVPAVGDPTPFQVLFKSADPNALSWKPLRPVVSSNYQPAPQPVEGVPAAPAVGSYPQPILPPAPSAAPAPAAAPAGIAPGRIAAPNAAIAVDNRLVLLLLAAILFIIAANWSARLRRLLAPQPETVRGVGRFARARTAHARSL